MEFDSEEEQIEAIKAWLKTNGLPIVLGIIVVVAATIGWRQWQAHQYKQSAQASVVYAQMQQGLKQAVAPGNVKAMKAVQQAADILIREWPKSAYADFGHLALAKQAVKRGDYDQAIDQLKQVADKPATKAQGYTAQLRLARVYVQADKLDDALAVVNTGFPDAWKGQALELKGDILFQQKDTKGAQKAYNAALEAYGKSNAAGRINMKLNRLKAPS